MCFKIVIENQVADAKFIYEKLKKNAFLACISIAVSISLDLSRFFLPP